jgi:hypothetical protein
MKQYTLVALQMAYLPLTMKKETEGEKCVYCWSSGCGCESKTTTKNDPFLNLSAEELYDI